MAGWITDGTTDTVACGSGKSTHSIRQSHGTRVTREMRVSGGVSFTDARRTAEMEFEPYTIYEATGLTLRTDSEGGAYASPGLTAPSSGYCAVSTLGGAADGSWGSATKNYYANWSTKSGHTTFSGSDTNVVLLTQAFTDSQLWVRIRAGQVDTINQSWGYYGIFGRRITNSSGQAVYDAFFPVGDSPGYGGGIPAESWTDPSTSSTTHPRQSGAAVVLGGAGNQGFLSFESEGQYSGSALEAYIMSGGTGIPLPWLAECVQSAHMDAWATVCPNYDDEVVGGSGSGGLSGGSGGGGADTNSIAGKLPIGAE